MTAPTNADTYQSPFQKPILSVATPADFSSVLTIAFFFIFIGWLLYSIVASYHWFRYSHRSWLAVPAVAMHVFISGLLIFYIASGV
jgi:H+/Cl- antiporter ClcA